MKKKAALHNLGCKVNAYEVEAMQQLLEQAGYEIVPFEPGADVYVINTCTVTNIADRKSRQMLHKAKKMNPEAVVVATGCYVQTDQGKLDKDPAVDLIIGNSITGILHRGKDSGSSLEIVHAGLDPRLFDHRPVRSQVAVEDRQSAFRPFGVFHGKDDVVFY